MDICECIPILSQSLVSQSINKKPIKNPVNIPPDAGTPIRPVHHSAPQSLDREMVPANVPVPKGRTYVKYMHII